MPDLLDPLSVGTRADELTSDDAFLAAMFAAELALIRSLVQHGVAPGFMTLVCDALRMPQPAAIAESARAGGNPVIPLVKLLQRDAEALHVGASDYIHLGATSQDVMDTASMLIARGVLDEVSARLDQLGDALVALIETHRTTPMVGRTLGQQAAPTTFGFVAAVWLDAVTDALGAVSIALPAQLGGAVGTQSVLADVAGAAASGVASTFANELGLAEPPITWHSNRSVVARLAGVLGQAVGAAGLLALDVTVLARTEVGELQERLGTGEGGSSAMPHKRNPVTAVLVTAAARQAPALVGSLAGSMLSEDQRPSGAWHAEWLPLRALERLAITATAGAASLAGRLEVDAHRMLQNLAVTNGLVSSERVATTLAGSIGRTTAFALVERASRGAHESGRPLHDVVAELLLDGGHDGTAADAAFDLAPSPLADLAIDRVLARYQKARS